MVGTEFTWSNILESWCEKTPLWIESFKYSNMLQCMDDCLTYAWDGRQECTCFPHPLSLFTCINNECSWELGQPIASNRQRIGWGHRWEVRHCRGAFDRRGKLDANVDDQGFGDIKGTLIRFIRTAWTRSLISYNWNRGFVSCDCNHDHVWRGTLSWNPVWLGYIEYTLRILLRRNSEHGGESRSGRQSW